ncbi:hypothetical protein SDC9_100807 [bioreactor metagenome]|uniref:Uncharacterized protein n=1 Tax=bioreactor metagenome TaxID=1076179 RepID=A0A645AWX1_9ZZZZ
MQYMQARTILISKLDSLYRRAVTGLFTTNKRMILNGNIFAELFFVNIYIVADNFFFFAMRGNKRIYFGKDLLKRFSIVH